MRTASIMITFEANISYTKVLQLYKLSPHQQLTKPLAQTMRSFSIFFMLVLALVLALAPTPTKVRIPSAILKLPVDGACVKVGAFRLAFVL